MAGLGSAIIEPMDDTVRKGAWGFLLRPWRYDFEYARAWRELDFPLYGICEPRPNWVRMGGKGRGGVVPPRPLRYLPPGLWTELNHLGVIAEGEHWEVEVDTSTPPGDLHPDVLQQVCRHHARHGRHRAGSGAGEVTARSHDLLVDGVPMRFDGFELDQVWVGTTSTSKVTISLVASNIAPEMLGLSEIIDPGPYLRGQRKIMRR